MNVLTEPKKLWTLLFVIWALLMVLFVATAQAQDGGTGDQQEDGVSGEDEEDIGDASTATPRPSTATPVPAPTRCWRPGPYCPVDTPTPKPATATPEPPATDTPIPPPPVTDTPVPATDTPIPPPPATATDTPVPHEPDPTATPRPLRRLSAPSGLQVTFYNHNRASLRWNDLSGADRYRVDRKSEDDDDWGNSRYSSDNTITMSGLAECTTYSFRVSARGDGSRYSRQYGATSGSVSVETHRAPSGGPIGEGERSGDDGVSGQEEEQPGGPPSHLICGQAPGPTPTPLPPLPTATPVPQEPAPAPTPVPATATHTPVPAPPQTPEDTPESTPESGSTPDETPDETPDSTPDETPDDTDPPEATPEPTTEPPGATPEPTDEPEPEPVPTPPESESPAQLKVSIAASPAAPAVASSVKLPVTISNAPSGQSPSYQWQMRLGNGEWINASTRSDLSYYTEKAETISFQLTVTYGSAGSATSNIVIVTWVNPPPTPTPMPTPVYADLIEAPGPSRYCTHVFQGGSSVNRLLEDSDDAESADKKHTARAEIWGSRQYLSADTYCVEARFKSESTPGAASITWSGDLHWLTKTMDKTGLDLSNLTVADVPDLIRRYTVTAPARTASPTRVAPPKSCNACKGGTIQTEQAPNGTKGGYILVEAAYFREPALYAYGSHTFNEGPPVTLTTSAEWIGPSPDVPEACKTQNPDLGAGGLCALGFAARFESELAQDIDTGIYGNVIQIIANYFAQQR